MGRGGGLVISVLDLCSDDPSSILADCKVFSVVLYQEKTGKTYLSKMVSRSILATVEEDMSLTVVILLQFLPELLI